MLSIKAVVVAWLCGILPHSSCNAVSNSATFVIVCGLLLILLSSSDHKCSIGFKSGDWLGQSGKILILFIKIHFLTSLAVWTGALSSWNQYPLQLNSSFIRGNKWFSSICFICSQINSFYCLLLLMAPILYQKSTLIHHLQILLLDQIFNIKSGTRSSPNTTWTIIFKYCESAFITPYDRSPFSISPFSTPFQALFSLPII